MLKVLLNLKSFLAPHRLIRVRQRYFLTRTNTLRLRYSAGSAISVLVLCAFTFSTGGALRFSSLSSATALPEVANTAGYSRVTAEADLPILSPLSRVSFHDLIKASAPVRPEYPKKSTLKIGSGETVAGVLQRNGVSSSDATDLVASISEYVDVRKIPAGQAINIVIDRHESSDDPALTKMSMDLDPIKSVRVIRGADGEFSARLEEKEVRSRTVVGEAEIETSLYGSAARSGIPAPVIARMIKMYSWAVDFQRDIRAHDKIQVMYDVQETEDGKIVGYGDIQFANLNLGGIDLSLYQYEHEDGHTDYYDELGRSIRKTLMKTPIDGARISSGFGMRKHPVLGYNKMHKGMDFAASVGTPIYAAGDGVIDKIGRNGSYGNYISIRHNNTLKTAYAHMQRFNKGLSNGSRVRQGDVIGYVGTTGRSTGPHLHFEVLLDNQQVNPNRVDLPMGEHLKGNDLKKFKRQKNRFHQQYVALTKGQNLAQSSAQKKDGKDAG